MSSYEIRQELARLSSDRDLESLQPLIARLQQMATASPPVVDEPTLQIIVDLLRRVSPQLAGSHSPEDLIQETIDQVYVQPEWQVQNVNQAREVIQFFYNDYGARSEAPRFRVPVVPLVMNATQAAELDALTALEGCPEEIRSGFEGLLVLLERHGRRDDWTKHYRDEPRDWRPFSGGANAESLDDLVTEALARIEDPPEPLEPHFVEASRLDGERSLLACLRRDGCIAIIDTISLYHPEIQRLLQRTLLDVFPNTLVIKVAPLSDVLEQVVRVARLMEPPPRVDREFQHRFQSDLDELCHQVHSPLELTRFLKSFTPSLWSSTRRRSSGSIHSRFFGQGAG